MTDRNGNLVINIARTHALLGIVAVTLGIAATVWGTVWTATKWAIRDEVRAQVDLAVGGEIEGVRAWVRDLKVAADIEHGTFARRDSVSNMGSLFETRLTAIEKRQDETYDLLRQLLLEQRNGRRSDQGGG